MTPEERTKAKNKEAGRIVLSKERAEGKQEGKIEIARNLILLDLDNDTIAKATGLSVEEIEALRQEN